MSLFPSRASRPRLLGIGSPQADMPDWLQESLKSQAAPSIMSGNDVWRMRMMMDLPPEARGVLGGAGSSSEPWKIATTDEAGMDASGHAETVAAPEMQVELSPPDAVPSLEKLQNQGLPRDARNIMRNRLHAQSALLDDRVQTALDTISQAEGNTEYNARYGKKEQIEDFSRFPAQGVSGTPSGRYQIDRTTYEDIAPRLGITDFSPESQDIMAAYLLEHAGNQKPSPLDKIRGGNFGGALNGLSHRWASLPQGPDDPGRYERAGTTYNKAQPYDTVMKSYYENLKRRSGY